ncbi:hypothetical protein D3C75_1358230 [compost metagenome]
MPLRVACPYRQLTAVIDVEVDHVETDIAHQGARHQRRLGEAIPRRRQRQGLLAIQYPRSDQDMTGQ